uniref:Uncharacterized protein n=1 Tax=Rhizophora mucronata TaxID=61149 RepID=A0A2P2QCZ0_RHIMU
MTKLLPEFKFTYERGKYYHVVNKLTLHVVSN